MQDLFMLFFVLAAKQVLLGPGVNGEKMTDPSEVIVI